MKKFIKGFLKTMLFLIILCGIFGYLSYVFMPKNNDEVHGVDRNLSYAYLGEPKNTIDVLAIGDSLGYSSFIPMEIYHKYGITSYVGCTPSQNTFQTYDMLKKVLKRQKIKVVVVEVSNFFRSYAPKQFDALKLENIFPVFKYHHRWKSLTKKDFLDDISYTHREVNKGYLMRMNTKPYLGGEYMIPTDYAQPLDDLNMDDFIKIINLAKENDIHVLLYSAPSAKTWNYARHNGIQKLADEYNIDYLDFNINHKEMVDWKKNTDDGGEHINYWAAVKVTDKIADYLNDLGYLNDHRKDPKYKQWSIDYKVYKKAAKEHRVV